MAPPPKVAVVTPPKVAVVTPPKVAVAPPPKVAVVTPPKVAVVTPPKVAVAPPPKVAVVTPPPPPVVISPPPDTVVGYTLNTDKSCGSAAVRGTSFSSFAAAQTVCNNNPNCKAISKPAASTTMYTNFSGTIAPATNQGSRCYVKQ